MSELLVIGWSQWFEEALKDWHLVMERSNELMVIHKERKSNQSRVALNDSHLLDMMKSEVIQELRAIFLIDYPHTDGKT